MLRLFGLSRHTRPAKPESRVLCFGRDSLCEDVVRSTFSQGCALLFGGRQSGKTTVLRNIARQLADGNYRNPTPQIRVPVFVDLMRLPYDARPADFFATLASLSIDACAEQCPAVLGEKNFASRVNGLESFETAIARVRSRASHVDLRFAYLLDESKRIIGDRFPRGFHDNLFHVLFGNSKIQGVCNIVFAGAQELYRLCEDDTSPIGSRAAKHCLMNLTAEAVGQMAYEVVQHPDKGRARVLADQVYEWTGGHAGLSAGLLRALAMGTTVDAGDIQNVVARFRKERSELFQLWVNSLTIEARVIHDALLDRSSLTVTEIVELLRRKGLAVHRCDRVADELQYVGLARREGERLVSCNRIYLEIARLYAGPVANTELERSVWALVEQTEVGLRQLVRVAFDSRWGSSADANIRLGIGEDAWLKVIENRDKYAKSYPRTMQTVDSDEVLNFTYLGQLGQLMMWNKAWDLFKGLFRDKREFEDMIRDIVPVRNDGAHFRAVPEHELNRCRVRCVDLLTILERNRQVTITTI
ncbi:MAG: hypothetical protein ABSE42_10400 [Bryobacteraceae bacterium]